MACNKCNNCLDVCDCNCTTTTTCSPVAEKPCIVICDDLYATECIIYDGEDNICHDIKKGDKVKDIINKIINKILPNNCSCEYGNATINLVTTTSSTTSTTTIPVNSLCFTLYSTLNCNFEPTTITSGPFINGKESYSFTINSTNYIIKWSIIEDRWELYSTIITDYLAYLESDSLSPIAPLMGNMTTNKPNSWISNGSIDSIYFTTRKCCPQDLCGTVEIEGGSFDVTFKSPYDILASLPSQPINLKHYYKGCFDQDIYEIKWNIFTNRYEMYYNGLFVAHTLQSYLDQTNEITWIIDPGSFGTPFYGLKTKTGACFTPEIETICVSFIGGLQFNDDEVTNSTGTFNGVVNGKSSYIVESPASPGNFYYIYWSIINNRWEIVTDINDPSSTIYAYLLNSRSDDYPIGFSWECASNDDSCYKSGDGNVATRESCNDPGLDCKCVGFKLNGSTLNATPTITYTDCNGNDITQTIVINSGSVVIRRCIKLNTPITISGTATTRTFTRLCDSLFNNCNSTL